MRKSAAGLVLLSAIAVGIWLAFRPHASSARKLSDLPPDERRSIEAACLSTMSLLRDGRSDELWRNAHPVLRSATSDQEFLRAVQDLRKKIPSDSRFEVASGWRLVKHGGSSAPHEFICGPLHATSPGHYRVRSVAGVDDFAACLVPIASRPVGRTAVVLVGRHEDTFRLVHLDVPDTSYYDRGADYYESLGRRWCEEGKKLPAYLAFCVASHLHWLGPCVASGSALELKRQLAVLNLQKEIPSKWTVGGVEYPLVSVGIITTLVDISPHVRYVAQSGLEPASIESEAATLMEYVRAEYPDIPTEFPAVLFQAYERLPEEGKQCRAYGVPLFFQPEDREKEETGQPAGATGAASQSNGRDD